MSCDCEEQKTTDSNLEAVNRRSFLTKITIAIGGFIGTVLAFPLITAMLDPVTRKKDTTWRNVGGLIDFEEGKTKMVSFENASPYKWSGEIAYSAAYVRREEHNK